MAKSSAPVAAANAVPTSALNGLLVLNDLNTVVGDRSSRKENERPFILEILNRYLDEHPGRVAVMIDDQSYLPGAENIQVVQQAARAFDQQHGQNWLKAITAKYQPTILAMKVSMSSPYANPYAVTTEARRLLKELGDNITLLSWNSTPPETTNTITIKSAGNLSRLSNGKTDLLLSRDSKGKLLTLDPVEYGKAALSRYRFFEVQKTELQSQLGRLAVSIPDHYKILCDAGVIVSLDAQRATVNLD